MSVFKVNLLIMMAFCFTLASAYYIDGKRSEYLRENKRYMGDIEQREKRYVTDREDADAELRRYKRWEKMYVGEESAEEYFYREKEALYRYTSLQRNTVPSKDAKDKLAIILEDQVDYVDTQDNKTGIEKKGDIKLDNKRVILNKERVGLNDERIILNNERTSLNNKRIIPNNERTSLNNKRIILSKERTSLNNKRVKLEILKVTIEE